VTLQINEIWTKVLEGDSAAWKVLVRHYSSLVYTAATRRGLSAMDAEDCAQHTWISLFRHKHSIKDPVRLPSWLIRTAQRRAGRMLQQTRRSHTIGNEQEERLPDPMPDEEVLLLERQALIEIALQRIDKRCAVVLRELFFAPESMSYRQIARSLGVSPNTLGSLRSRCLKRLREILEEMGYDLH